LLLLTIYYQEYQYKRFTASVVEVFVLLVSYGFGTEHRSRVQGSTSPRRYSWWAMGSRGGLFDPWRWEL